VHGFWLWRSVVVNLSGLNDGKSGECLYLLQLADAFEEVEEQRQVVGQWKRKVQKLTAETNDLRHLLEEQSSRNNLLEKKQRK
jgi:hypothetical protein